MFSLRIDNHDNAILGWFYLADFMFPSNVNGCKLSSAFYQEFFQVILLQIDKGGALVAFFGGSFMTAVSGDGIWTSAILAGVALAWLALMLVVRELVKRRELARGD